MNISNANIWATDLGALVQQRAGPAVRRVRKHAGRSPLPPWLVHLGAVGIFGVSVLDSSVIPLPLPGSTDLLLLFLVAHGGNPWLLAACAIAGSIIGGYLTWGIGKKGGEPALQRFVSRRYLRRISRWVERHALLSVVLPAILPPPIPLLPFLLAAGALGVSRKRFLYSFSAARTIRYGLVAWLGVKYGRAVVHIWEKYVADWSTPVLWTLLAITVAGVGYGVWKFRQIKKTLPAAGHAEAAGSDRTPVPVAGP